jgi:hypothetical protein
MAREYELDSSGSGQGAVVVVSSYDHGNEVSCSTKGGVFIDCLCVLLTSQEELYFKELFTCLFHSQF